MPWNFPGMARRLLAQFGLRVAAENFTRLFPRWLFVLVLAFSVGCGIRERPADLVIINGPEPESLDPAIQTGQADGRVVGSLFEGLTRYNSVTANPEPGLAERWEISPDNRTYTFFLRTNAAWSTGEPITADDVVYSWLRLLKPETGCEYVGLLFYIKNAEAFNSHSTSDPTRVGVRALDARILRVELEGPTAFFLDLCATPTLAVVPRATIEKFGDRWLMVWPLPVSGAYQLESWRLNDKIRLRKNPRYWDAANTQSEVVDLLPCTLASTALNLYQTGAADIVWDKELVPNELLDVVLKRSDFHAFNYLGTYFFRFNVTRKPFDDPRVRKALALAINKRRLVEKFARAGESVADHYVPDGTGDYHAPAGLGYDPAEARRLLAEAGFPGGKNFPPFHYLYNANGKIHEQIALELKEMWKQELGLNLDLRKLEWKVYLTTQSKTDFDLCRSSWIGDYNDPNTFLDMFMGNNGNNRTGWKNARYDQFVREGNQQADPVAREKLLRTAEQILVKEELPIVPLYFYAGCNYWDPGKIQGISNNIRDEHPIRVIRKTAASRRIGLGETRTP
ncbi:MAG: peptide ABC transporter substrate-binding protein [Verrucomicrobia bacterium]|nr:peptide ABC transporter substrate-binding protein [Verrucomicrobiota bacterium]